MHANQPPGIRSDAGFSLVEVLLVIALVSVLSGITIIAFQAAARQLRGDSNSRIVTWQLQVARETAMSQRRDVEVRFMDPNGIAMIRHDLPNGTTLLSTVYLEGNVRFALFPGVPDTPDGFGNATPVAFGPATALMFTAEGAFVDQQGRAVNGSIFFGVASQVETARAITIFGPTGRVRSYRWHGQSGWVH
jgi:prepilin-type N-terminal cleavage/methylation domain-containing protein